MAKLALIFLSLISFGTVFATELPQLPLDFPSNWYKDKPVECEAENGDVFRREIFTKINEENRLSTIILFKKNGIVHMQTVVRFSNSSIYLQTNVLVDKMVVTATGDKWGADDTSEIRTAIQQAFGLTQKELLSCLG